MKKLAVVTVLLILCYLLLMGIQSNTIRIPDFDKFKIVKTGSATVTIDSGDAYNTITTTVAHNLGYTPIVMAFVDVNTVDLLAHSGRTPVPYTIYEATTTSSVGFHDNTVYVVIGHVTANADDTNIYFSVGTHDTAFYTQLQGDYSFTYYLLQESSNP